jgi:DNA polymerase III epsilon subunit family exonuclease
MNIIVFDTETTGLLQPENSDLIMQPKITEIYAVKINEEFEMLDEYSQLINVGEPLTKEIIRITGITDDMLKNEPPFVEVADDIMNFFEDSTLAVGHNLAFDNGMLDVEYKRIDRARPILMHNLCTVEATMGMTGHRLSLTRLHWMLMQEQFKAHRAKDDVFALVRCLHQLTEKGIVKFNEYKEN